LATERDYYSILQVSRGASQETIERAHERLARLYDPAVSKKTKAATRWQELSEAYEVLSDKQRRAEYDRRSLRSARVGSGAALRGRLAMPEFISSPYFLAGATVAGVLAIVVALIAISALGGGSGESAVSNPTVSVAVGTPAATATGPTGPASPPEVTGEEIATGSGLKYVDLQVGTGDSPSLGQAVTVNYTGWLAADGTKFDSSIDRGSPSNFTLGQVIEGWNEGLATMKEGGKRRLIIPPELGYGAAGSGQIPANAALIFDVELIEVQ